MHFYRKSAIFFIFPMLTGLLVFRVVPIAAAFFASFTEWNVYAPPRWIGLANYKELLHSAEFWNVSKQTIVFSALYTAGVCTVGLFFAVLLNQKLPAIRFFRVIYFIPVITTVSAVGLIWSWLLSPQNGLVNSVLAALFPAYEKISWLGDKKYALFSLAAVYIWKSAGYQMILYLAGLQGLPKELHEAAKIDGANKMQSFFRVTLPLLTPTLFFVLVVTIIESLQTFEITYSMTEGGPYGRSTTLSYYIYQYAFVHYRMGYASGLSYVMFLFALLVTAVNYGWRRKWVNDQ